MGEYLCLISIPITGLLFFNVISNSVTIQLKYLGYALSFVQISFVSLVRCVIKMIIKLVRLSDFVY